MKMPRMYGMKGNRTSDFDEAFFVLITSNEEVDWMLQANEEHKVDTGSDADLCFGIDYDDFGLFVWIDTEDGGFYQKLDDWIFEGLKNIMYDLGEV